MRNSLLLGLGLFVALLAGVSISSPVEAGRYRCAQCGTVEDVDRIWYDGRRDDRRDDRRDSGTEGAVIGAIIGGALGNQVGGGSGRTAATVAGVVVGGLVGRDIDRNNGRGNNNNNNRGERGMRLVVRMDRGGYQTVEIHGEMRIYRGDRVRLRDGRVDIIN